MSKIKVVVTDDHPVVLTGLATLLAGQDDMELVGQYTSGKDLLDGLKNRVPDILLLDIKLPDIGGDTLVTTILESYPDIKIIALTYLDSAYYIKLMMKRGAKGYLLKTSKRDILVEAIRQVYSGEQYLEESIKEKVLQVTLGQGRNSEPMSSLTKREMEVLQLIASNYSSQQIAGKLYISKRTVENHRASMLLKMKVKNAPALVKRAIEMNLL